MSHDDRKLSAILSVTPRFPLLCQLNFSYRTMPHIPKGLKDLLLMRSLKKNVGILKKTRGSSSSSALLSSSSSSKRRTELSSPPQLSLKPLACLRRLPGGRGERRRSSSSNYFSLASKHFNATSTNELVLFSLPRNPLRHPPSEQNRVTSSPDSLPSPVGVTSPPSYAYAIPTGPPLNAESALFQLRERQ